MPALPASGSSVWFPRNGSAAPGQQAYLTCELRSTLGERGHVGLPVWEYVCICKCMCIWMCVYMLVCIGLVYVT